MPANYGNHIACPAPPSVGAAGGGSAAAAAATAAAAAAVATLSNGGNPNVVSPSAAAALVNGNAASGLKVCPPVLIRKRRNTDDYRFDLTLFTAWMFLRRFAG